MNHLQDLVLTLKAVLASGSQPDRGHNFQRLQDAEQNSEGVSPTPGPQRESFANSTASFKPGLLLVKRLLGSFKPEE